jgi:hypothetical protein
MEYIIENSVNGIVKTNEDQFKTASFETLSEAKTFIKELIRYQEMNGYDFKNSYFQIIKRVNSEDDGVKVSNKIYA